MKYFIDTEFKEYYKQHKFCSIKVGYPTPTIDLISIAIVSETGNEFYALNKECDLKEVWNDQWLRENVLMAIYKTELSYLVRNENKFSYETMRRIFDKSGLSRFEIKFKILNFINAPQEINSTGISLDDVIVKLTHSDDWRERWYPKEFEYINKHNTFIPKATYRTGYDNKGVQRNRAIIYNRPEFYAYYANYDWVAFCQLFGRMMDLPQGYPMYCRDLKQIMDEFELDEEWKEKNAKEPEGIHDALIDAKFNLNLYNEIIKEIQPKKLFKINV